MTLEGHLVGPEWKKGKSKWGPKATARDAFFCPTECWLVVMAVLCVFTPHVQSSLTIFIHRKGEQNPPPPFKIHEMK
jgi:hypothetical protein